MLKVQKVQTVKRFMIQMHFIETVQTVDLNLEIGDL